MIAKKPIKRTGYFEFAARFWRSTFFILGASMSKNIAILEAAKSQLGTWEWAGADHNPAVLVYYKASGFPEIGNDEVPWCAAFMGWVCQQAGVEGTGSLLAQSYLKWGEAVSWENARPGDVFIWKRGTKSWQGHVNILVEKDGQRGRFLGGNQRDQVNIIETPVANGLLGIRRAKAAKSSPVQSTTLQAAGGGAVATAAGGLTALGSLDGNAQLVALVCVTVVLLAFIWIGRERVKKWATGVR